MEQRRFAEESILTLITKFDRSILLHESEVQSLQAQFKTFNTIIPQNENIARAGEWSDTPRGFVQKYGDASPVVEALAAEFQERIGLL